MGYMYILQCSDGSYYTGSTIDLQKRLRQHQSGKGANYTANRLPVALVYLEYFDKIYEAFKREKQIQKWSRIKKEALISSNIVELQKLAKKKFGQAGGRMGLSTKKIL